MFAALAAELAGPAAAGLTACGLEELLDERGREVMRQLLQDHFDLRKIREEQQARCGKVIGKRQIEESVVHAAAGIPAFCASRIPEPCTRRRW
jgi:transcriptional regulatory protein LevR